MSSSLAARRFTLQNIIWLNWNFNKSIFLLLTDNNPQTLMGQFIHLLQNNSREVKICIFSSFIRIRQYQFKLFFPLRTGGAKQSDKFGWLKFELGVISRRFGLQCRRGELNWASDKWRKKRDKLKLIISTSINHFSHSTREGYQTRTFLRPAWL